MIDKLIRYRMVSRVKYLGINKILLMVILAVQLTACGGGGGGGGGGASGSGTVDIASAVRISGSVGDGPVTGATIVVYADNGKELATMTSDSNASFQTIINAKEGDYPLLIKATGGFDLVTGAAPAFEMLSVMLSPSEKQQNINPFTTLIIKTAQRLPGGLNANNVETARTTVMNTLGFGLDPNLIPDPITTTINTSNAASIIKASEVLTEMVRRTSSTLSVAGKQISNDDVMKALAADFKDGFLDGRGARGANARVASVAAVVSAQVLVEALRNSLKVEGLVATGMLDEAIGITQPGISSTQLTAGVRITAGMLRQTKTALAAAMVLDSSSQVEAIATRVGAIAPNALPADVASVLATDASTYLENAVVLSASATKQQMASIWQVIPGSGSTDNSISIDNDSIIMDNADAGFSMVGNWSSSTGVAGYYGGNYEFSDMGDGSSMATWQFDIATSGNYNVEARWTANSGRATDAPYTLYNNGTLVARVTKNQQINGGQFNPLGSYKLTAGTLEVVLDNKASGFVVADAVQVSSGGTTGGGTTGGGTTGGGATGGGTTSGGTTSGGTALSGTPDPIQTGRLTLQWTAPVTRTDGTPLSLSDIDGYRIHYGKSSGNYTNHYTLADGTAQTVSLTGIPVGSYHLVMTTYDVDGRESGYSSEVIRIVQ